MDPENILQWWDLVNEGKIMGQKMFTSGR